jgi:hypothetical protein
MLALLAPNPGAGFRFEREYPNKETPELQDFQVCSECGVWKLCSHSKAVVPITQQPTRMFMLGKLSKRSNSIFCYCFTLKG